MLYSYFFSYSFSVFCKSGFYIDFLLKKLSEVFIRNFFIYSAQFFGEKYIIEVFTKKIFNNVIFSLNKLYGFTRLNFSTFFFQFLIFLFYFVIFVNFIFLFF